MLKYLDSREEAYSVFPVVAVVVVVVVVAAGKRKRRSYLQRCHPFDCCISWMKRRWTAFFERPLRPRSA